MALMIPGLGRIVARPRAFATRHNRTVVSTSGFLTVMDLPAGRVTGCWACWTRRGGPGATSSCPIPGPWPPAGDGRLGADADTFPLPDADGWVTGFVSADLGADDDGGRTRLLGAARVPTATSLVTYNAQLHAYGAKRDVPWPLGTTVYEALHGFPGVVSWITRDGRRDMSGRDHARAVVRWFSLAQVSPRRSQALLICFSAARRALAASSDTECTTARCRSSPTRSPWWPSDRTWPTRPRRRRTAPSTALPRRRWRTAPWPWPCSPTPAGGRPSGEVPAGAGGHRARRAGPDGRLHHGPGPASEATRDRALRLVRALREAFDDPDVDLRPDYPDLLRGLGALDRMRERDPDLDRDGNRKFTLDLLHRVVRRFPPGRPGTRPGGPSTSRRCWPGPTPRGRPGPGVRSAASPRCRT
ncbi:hypothetical protein SAZ11_00475 [Streptomyces sp. FXJ1.4098]|nr:hypothetical protein [Streptomyces sp. FXJ1.4098]